MYTKAIAPEYPVRPSVSICMKRKCCHATDRALYYKQNVAAIAYNKMLIIKIKQIQLFFLHTFFGIHNT